MRIGSGLICALLVAGCGGRRLNQAEVTISIRPQSVALPAGGTQRFVASVSGASDPSTAWSLAEGPAAGEIAADGTYTAPGIPGTYHLVARAGADPRKSAAATITVSVTPAVAISIAPSAADLVPGSKLQLRATISGSTDRGVLWSVREGATAGSIDSNGLYTAPETAGLYHVVASSSADPSKAASAAIAVGAVPTITVSIDPPAATLVPGGTLQFRAALTGTVDEAVVWSIAEGAASGSVDANGIYRAPDREGICHIVATSHADPTKSASTEVKVTRGVTVTVAPGSVTVSPGEEQRFSASVSGVVDGRVKWAVAEGTAGGTIDSSGLYSAPFAAGSYHVVATSVADPSRSASAQVAVLPASVGISISPSSVTVKPDDRIMFEAKVTGTADVRVHWEVGCCGGSVTSDGVYTAPHEAGDYQVTARSVADPAKSATATIVVSPATSYFDVIDHGGDVAAATRTFALWWGDPAAYPADVESTAEALLRELDGSSYLAIADQYLRGKRATTAFAGSVRDGSEPPSSAPDAVMNNIGPAVCRALDSTAVTPTAGDMVLVFGSSGITFPTGWRPYCAWHSWWSCHGTNVLVAFIPNPSGTGGCLDGGRILQCNSASDAANAVASAVVHELMEAVTDPFVTAWYDANDQEIADKCMDKLGVGCVKIGSMTFQVQSEYSNAIHGCTR